MNAICPICGNYITVNPRYSDGKCKFCKQQYDVKITKKGNKSHVNLVEKLEKVNKI